MSLKDQDSKSLKLSESNPMAEIHKAKLYYDNSSLLIVWGKVKRQLGFLHLFLCTEIIPMFTYVFQDFYPPCFQPTARSLFPRKLPAVTHFLFFQTACKMMSRRCIIAGPISAKNVYYLFSQAFALN